MSPSRSVDTSFGVYFEAMFYVLVVVQGVTGKWFGTCAKCLGRLPKVLAHDGEMMRRPLNVLAHGLEIGCRLLIILGLRLEVLADGLDCLTAALNVMGAPPHDDGRPSKCIGTCAKDTGAGFPYVWGGVWKVVGDFARFAESKPQPGRAMSHPSSPLGFTRCPPCSDESRGSTSNKNPARNLSLPHHRTQSEVSK